MYKNSFYISFGVWIAIIPFFGIPGTWRNVIVFVSGIFFILVSLGPIILRKLEVDTKPKKETPNDKLKFSSLEENKVETEKEV